MYPERISFSLNTDDPTIKRNCSMTKEFELFGANHKKISQMTIIIE